MDLPRPRLTGCWAVLSAGFQGQPTFQCNVAPTFPQRLLASGSCDMNKLVYPVFTPFLSSNTTLGAIVNSSLTIALAFGCASISGAAKVRGPSNYFYRDAIPPCIPFQHVGHRA